MNKWNYEHVSRKMVFRSNVKNELPIVSGKDVIEVANST